MADRDDVVLRLLGPALKAARAALQDREPDEVPSSLRRVVAATGKRLPPPLAAALLDALDDQGGLRSESLEKWPEADLESANPEVRASALFLERPAGWVRLLLRETEELSQRGTRARIEELDLLNEKTTSQLKESKRRLKVAKAEAAIEARRHARAVEAARKEAAAVEPRTDDRVDEPSERHKAELESASRALEAANEDMTDMARRLRVARRERAEALRKLAAGGDRLTREPLELARRLDAMAAMAARRIDEPDGETVNASVVDLPTGIRPDSSEAIDHLLGMETPVRFIVDGHNLLFRLGAGIDATARDRLNHDLVRFKRLAAGAMAVTVIYDSSLPGPRDAARTVSGLDVRYASEDSTADDEIVALVDGDAVVVVTDDRLLRERVERKGATALWSGALADWLHR
ncbi:MAG: hypothetical protein HKN07_11945 [Acidimicrobiia bacterium]|nr:hypothetical protein [Acidimicrobiia bacterium]